MKRFALLVIALSLAPAAHADLTHKIQSSVQLQVGGATTTADRIGSTFSISGSGVDTTDSSTANTISTGDITSGVYSPGTIDATQATAGNAFSFSQSYMQGDALPTAAPTTGAVQTLAACNPLLLERWNLSRYDLANW
jgi:hypothetical protein